MLFPSPFLKARTPCGSVSKLFFWQPSHLFLSSHLHTCACLPVFLLSEAFLLLGHCGCQICQNGTVEIVTSFSNQILTSPTDHTCPSFEKEKRDREKEKGRKKERWRKERKMERFPSSRLRVDKSPKSFLQTCTGRVFCKTYHAFPRAKPGKFTIQSLNAQGQPV